MTLHLSMKVIGSKRTYINPDQGTDDSESHLDFKRTCLYPDQGTDDFAYPDRGTRHWGAAAISLKLPVPLTAKTHSTKKWWIQPVLILLQSFCVFRSGVSILICSWPQFLCLHVKDTFVFAIPVESNTSSILVNYPILTGDQQRGILSTIYRSYCIGLPLPCSWIPLLVPILHAKPWILTWLCF
jgi:hypothetical protein